MTPKQRARCIRAATKTYRAEVYRVVTFLGGWENYRMCRGLGDKSFSLRNAMQRWFFVTDRRKVKRLRRKGLVLVTSRTRFGRVALREVP